MARYKRYFPVSHEINRDPELWEITDQHGDRALRFVLEIFCLLDLKENELRITPKLMTGLSKMLRQSLAKCWRILGQMVANHWLIVGEVSADGSPSVVSARNYAQYHRTRSVIGNQLGKQTENFGGEGMYISSSLQSSLKENKIPKRKKNEKGLIASNGKLANANKPEDVSESVWQDFLKVRRAKDSPLTPTALKGLQREAAKAKMPLEDVLTMCVERSWQGFKASWATQEEFI